MQKIRIIINSGRVREIEVTELPGRETEKAKLYADGMDRLFRSVKESGGVPCGNQR